ncbi:hypothetical protein [Catenuloplanes atrovinosus]|uniref:Uncharacterized protein n=1 Tax=Catenuloplanes atrovinosus TaxID=137266 RepID=A0AAE4C9V2_9ACTN|nr:hypothetical protein [Catenuloplanes atrovinosus]MDR7276448.1 hypothetical protein [Catenuloplanes atrovinosus]
MVLLAPLHSTIELPVLAGRCAAALGDELTAYLAGADTVAELDAWCAGLPAPDPGHTIVRLAAGTELIRIFAAENLLSHLRHWLREMIDTEDGPIVPATAIRTATTDVQPIKTVLHAAHVWVTDQHLHRPLAA